MSQVKRFKMYVSEQAFGRCSMNEDNNGNYVKYDDYAAMEQRVEAAEEKLAELEQENSKLRQDRAGLARECNAFVAQLDELAKQEPAAVVRQTITGRHCAMFAVFPVGTLFYTRAVPAAPLHLPGEKVWRKDTGEEIASAIDWNACLAEVKRLNGLEEKHDK